MARLQSPALLTNSAVVAFVFNDDSPRLESTLESSLANLLYPHADARAIESDEPVSSIADCSDEQHCRAPSGFYQNGRIDGVDRVLQCAHSLLREDSAVRNYVSVQRVR